MKTRTVGLIGGMSWQTTSLYYTLINRHIARSLGGIHSANLLIRSVDYADIARFTTEQDFSGMAAMLVSRARELKAAGAEAVALCANVAHQASDDIESETGLDVLHIADFLGREVAKGGHRKAGLLGTKAVMEKAFYKARLTERYGLEVSVQGREFRGSIDGIIFHELSKDVVADDIRRVVKDAYEELVVHQKVDCVALACTEFRLVFGEKDFSVPTFETTSLHAEGIAEWALRTS